MANEALRARLVGDVERMWGWLERWGHHVDRVDLDEVDAMHLMDIKAAEQARVLALAAEWEVWW